MDIKAKAEELVSKITGNGDLLAKFKSGPKETVKGLVGDKIPDDVLDKLTDGIKAKIDIDDIKGKLGGLGNLFKK